jgi:hypothetical protein
MALRRMIDTLHSRRTPEGQDDTQEYVFLDGAVRIQARPSEYPTTESLIHDIDDNLERAYENGIKPISLLQILEQVPQGNIEFCVLSDTPMRRAIPGNTWRVASIDHTSATVTLQRCNTLGTRDFTEVSPVTVPSATPMFTTLYIYDYRERYREEDVPIPLSRVVELFHPVFGGESQTSGVVGQGRIVLTPDRDGVYGDLSYSEGL